MSEAWTRKEGQSKAGGLNEEGRRSYERANPGSDLKAPTRDKNSKRRKAFCSRMCGMKKRLTSAKTANDPNSRINKALRRWDCRCTQLAEIFTEYGITGVMVLLFAGQMAWLQKVLTQKLLDQYQILIKLIDRFNKSDDAYDRWQDKMIDNAERRHESVVKELNDLTDDMNYIKGIVSRLNGKH